MFRDPDCLRKLSFPARVIRHMRRCKMFYIWSAVVAAIGVTVWYFRLPLVAFPGLLFLTFLASGGRNFPRVFFRTILRDLMYVSLSCFLFVFEETQLSTSYAMVNVRSKAITFVQPICLVAVGTELVLQYKLDI